MEYEITFSSNSIYFEIKQDIYTSLVSHVADILHINIKWNNY